jgi:serine/threonine protein phosphatase PrpC
MFKKKESKKVAAAAGAGGGAWHTDFKFVAGGGQVEEDSEDDEDEPERHVVALEGVVESILGQRRKMEDACVVIDYLHLVCPELSSYLETNMDCGRNFSFYGVYDGHAGYRAARILKQTLHSHLFKNPLFTQRKVDEAIRTTFYDVDRTILEKGREEKWKDGACAVAAIVIDDYLYVGNAGDSECILGRRRRRRKHLPQNEQDVYPTEQERDFPDWLDMAPFPSPGHDAIVVSKAHKTTDPEENKRVVDAGGMITFGRLFGDLAVARAFGDSEYKVGAFISCPLFLLFYFSIFFIFIF